MVTMLLVDLVPLCRGSSERVASGGRRSEVFGGLRRASEVGGLRRSSEGFGGLPVGSLVSTVGLFAVWACCSHDSSQEALTPKSIRVGRLPSGTGEPTDRTTPFTTTTTTGPHPSRPPPPPDHTLHDHLTTIITTDDDETLECHAMPRWRRSFLPSRGAATNWQLIN